MQEDIEFAGAGRMLAATICTSTQQEADGELRHGIVFVHGLGSNRRGYVEYGERAAAQLGASCLALDLSGYGLSPGEASDISPAEHLQDVLAAWDELTARYRADPGRIGVCGSSYGACLATPGRAVIRQRHGTRLRGFPP